MEAPPVQYTKTNDGYNIAYSVSGQGRNVVLLPAPFNHIQHAWSFYPSWLSGLSQRYRLVQYDSRGWGLSGRGLGPEHSFVDNLEDLRVVIAATKAEPAVLIAPALGAHIAIRYAVSSPQDISALVLIAASIRMDAWPQGMWNVLPRENWDSFLELLASRYAGDQQQRFDQLKAMVRYEDWSIDNPVHRASTVEGIVGRLALPTLIVQPDSRMMPIDEGMKLAAEIPGSRFVVTSGPGESLLGNPDQGIAAIDAFLRETSKQPEAPDETRLSTREIEVLRLVAGGRSNAQIADELVISINTVQRHVSNIFDKIGAANRSEATAYALRNGFA